jgi:hypothetical protein
MESSEVLTLRAMDWQRAKGELQAMLATFWTSPGAGSDATRTEMEARVQTFCAEIEGNL